MYIRANRVFSGLFSILFLLVGCRKDEISTDNKTLFKLLDSSRTQLDFNNIITSSNELNIFKYRNFYNGGGVGLGDVNNDGLLDVYLTANMQTNKLFINKGNFVFEDVTNIAGVGGGKAWATGVSMIDINADGWMDIYVCNSGDEKGRDRENEFFINNGDGTFSEKAKEMGLDDAGVSTHAAFFDYDRDGDLDMYQLNNSYRSVNSFNLLENERNIRDSLGGDKLYRNDGDKFTDVSKEAGIYGSEIGFGLGIAVVDLDKDGWPDLYIANDFFERDYIYMNNHDGTFTESLEDRVSAISLTSMGVDAADLTNDGLPEIFVNDMLPQIDARFKTTMTFENWDKYRFNVENDYYHQFTRNTLQLNNGLLDDKGVFFSEVGRIANVEATDWSWSVLLTDLDNNGQKDIYITNGIYKDILDQDFIQYIANDEVAKMVIKKEGVDYKKLLEFLPSHPVANYAFSGNGKLNFEEVTAKWGLETPASSSGAAYGDLDNDGDLDLVVNNVNAPVFVCQNNSSTKENANYLKLRLCGTKDNLGAIGAKVTLKSGQKVFYQEQFLTRGFQSSVDPHLNFGLGSIKNIDTLLIIWPYGEETVMTNVAVNQALDLKEEEAGTARPRPNILKKKLFEKIDVSLDYMHQENRFVDFDHERMLYHMNSTQGPKISLADIDGDGKKDVFVSGAKDQPGALFLAKKGGFQKWLQEVFEQDQASEDVQNLFFDADGDGDQDLYVASGGSEFGNNSFTLIDRLYINDGKGNFTKSNQSLPVVTPQNTATVCASDYDRDGDLDLFVGVRMKNKAYGVPVSSYLLKNDGNGNFEDVTEKTAPGLFKIGMVTEANWQDIDGDDDEDLLVVGEWMGIKLFENQNGLLTEISEEAGLSNTSGWWNTIASADFNNDGLPDFVLGNHGLNSRFKATKEKPLSCYINDFDGNGTIEQIVCKYEDDAQYPTVLRHDLIAQLPGLKKSIFKYEDYKGKTVNDLFSQEQLQQAVVHEVTQLQSVVLLSTGQKHYEIFELPQEAQLAPIYALLTGDFDRDGIADIIAGGNLYGVKPEVGRYDASYGIFLKGIGDGTFDVVRPQKTGLLFEGQIRDLEMIEYKDAQVLIVVRNDDKPLFFKLKI